MELGSEFEVDINQLHLERNNLNWYLADYDYMYFDSGRSALKYVISNIRMEGKVLLPEFICESVIECFSIDEVEFYKIKEDFEIDVADLKRKITNNTRLILLMHYFGRVQNLETLAVVRNIADEYDVVIIEDTTHSIFSRKSTIGDYMICSIRKWIPVPRAGVAYSKKNRINGFSIKRSMENQRFVGFLMKDQYIHQRGWETNFAKKYNQAYRAIFSSEEDKIDNQNDMLRCSDFSEFLIKCFDVESLKKKRKENYLYLKNHLSELGFNPACVISREDCPMVLPLRVNNRDKLRKYLLQNRIYCAVHWPIDQIRIDERPIAIANAETLISLPIDQRYEKEDMDYLIKILSNYGGK